MNAFPVPEQLEVASLGRRRAEQPREPCEGYTDSSAIREEHHELVFVDGDFLGAGIDARQRRTHATLPPVDLGFPSRAREVAAARARRSHWRMLARWAGARTWPGRGRAVRGHAGAQGPRCRRRKTDRARCERLSARTDRIRTMKAIGDRTARNAVRTRPAASPGVRQKPSLTRKASTGRPSIGKPGSIPSRAVTVGWRSMASTRGSSRPFAMPSPHAYRIPAMPGTPGG